MCRANKSGLLDGLEDNWRQEELLFNLTRVPAKPAHPSLCREDFFYLVQCGSLFINGHELSTLAFFLGKICCAIIKESYYIFPF